jgi:chromosome segregation ATPase
MPTLIPDFARAMTESNRRAAESISEEIERVERLRERAEGLQYLKAEWDAFLPRVAREARSATLNVTAVAREVEGLWSSAVESFRNGLPADEQVAVLQAHADLARSGQDLLESVRRLWAAVERLGAQAEEADELADADRRFDRMRTEATRALGMRTTPWQPSDPARLEAGLQQARAGNVLSPEEVRARFRKDRA